MFLLSVGRYFWNNVIILFLSFKNNMQVVYMIHLYNYSW